MLSGVSFFRIQEDPVLRHLARLSVLAAALGAALAFSGSAVAAPSTPVLFPIASSVPSGSLLVKWTPSSFDAGTTSAFYELSVLDVSTSTLVQYAVSGTSKTIVVASGHTYTVCVRAGQVKGNVLTFSGSTCDRFKVGEAWGTGVIVAYWPGRPGYMPADYLVFERADGRLREDVLSARVVDSVQVKSVYADAFGARLVLA
jgi:hypothetical protein